MVTEEIIGKTEPISSAETVSIRISEVANEYDLLFKLVTYSSGAGKFLGIIDEISIKSVANKKQAIARNLLSKQEGGISSPPLNAPNIGKPVKFANEKDLEDFLIRGEFPKNAFIGNCKDTKFALPLDLKKLCFANTMILAGIGHGKSHVGAMLAYQMHLSGKRVMIIDPTGSWAGMFSKFKDSTNINGLPPPTVIHLSWNETFQDPSYRGFHDAEKPKAFVSLAMNNFESGAITVVDLAYLEKEMGEEEIKARSDIVRSIERSLFEAARSQYLKTQEDYVYNGVVFLDEAHEFVPNTISKYEVLNECRDLFAIGTKEGRKYGLGHVFLDQSLRALTSELEVQTFIMGRFTSPGNKEVVSSNFDKRVFDAVQRTRPLVGSLPPTWIVYGLASPLLGVSWEVESFDTESLLNVIQMNRMT